MYVVLFVFPSAIPLIYNLIVVLENSSILDVAQDDGQRSIISIVQTRNYPFVTIVNFNVPPTRFKMIGLTDVNKTDNMTI